MGSLNFFVILRKWKWLFEIHIIFTDVPYNVRRLCYQKSLDKNLQKLIDDEKLPSKFPKFGVPTLQTVWFRLPKLLQHLDFPELEDEQELEEEQELPGQQGEQEEQVGQVGLEKETYMDQQFQSEQFQSEQFQCLACPQQVTQFSTFPALEKHFFSVQQVQDLLGGPASSAVLLPSTLAIFNCKLCSQGECQAQTLTVWVSRR